MLNMTMICTFTIHIGNKKKIMVGRKIQVPVPKRDEKGKVINGVTYITGVCYSVGYNEILKCYTVTVDRYPVYPIELNKIKIL